MADEVLQYGNWTPALFKPHRRSIGGIIAAVTIEEQHEDDIQITEHPVEQGAPISDHAFKRPAQVTIQAGWAAAGFIDFFGVHHTVDLSAETGVYGLLLSWQSAFIPFDVFTGKRAYTNMLIERLSISTDKNSEFALIANITCKQVIIVSTQTALVSGMSDSANDHASPETTAPTQDGGDYQAENFGYVDPTAGTAYETTLGTTGTTGTTGATSTGFGYVDPTEGTPYQTSLGLNADNQMSVNAVAPPNNPPIDSRPERAVSAETQSILTEHQ